LLITSNYALPINVYCTVPNHRKVSTHKALEDENNLLVPFSWKGKSFLPS
jgi:hypothetical protein